MFCRAFCLPPLTAGFMTHPVRHALEQAPADQQPSLREYCPPGTSTDPARHQPQQQHRQQHNHRMPGSSTEWLESSPQQVTLSTQETLPQQHQQQAMGASVRAGKRAASQLTDGVSGYPVAHDNAVGAALQPSHSTGTAVPPGSSAYPQHQQTLQPQAHQLQQAQPAQQAPTQPVGMGFSSRPPSSELLERPPRAPGYGTGYRQTPIDAPLEMPPPMTTPAWVSALILVRTKL